MRKSEIIILAIICFSLIIALSLYQTPCFPEKVVSHWNIKGEVDGYLPKFWGLFLMPIISLAVFLFFLLLPKIDPLKENYKNFRKYYEGFMILLTVFFFYIYCLTILWNIGVRFNMARVMVPAISIFFFYIGILVENAKRNWFVGIRTPWTLSSDSVWDKTHKLGGKLFKVCSGIALLGLFLGSYAFWLAILPVMASSLFLLFYSWLVFHRQENQRLY